MMIDRLVEAIQKTHAPICVGLDPQMSFLPQEVTKKAYQEYGQTILLVTHDKELAAIADRVIEIKDGAVK